MSERSIPAGLRYMIEHGHAADGSHADNAERTQHLVNPPAHNPTRHAVVAGWIRARVAADRQMRDAAMRSQS
jgi:hypothetical protein